jgi:RecB family exonuclease
VHLRIDRIDALGSGGYAVLDYKTGRRIVPDWLSERPTPLQLLVYGCALPPEVAALATVSVNAHAVRFDGIARAAGLLPKVPALRSAAGEPAQAWLHQQAAWRELIERLMRAFLAGEAAVDPRPGACAFCHVADICRITEADLGVQEEAAEVAHE